jgi:hypothetical protein
VSILAAGRPQFFGSSILRDFSDPSFVSCEGLDSTQRIDFIVKTNAGNPGRTWHCRHIDCCFPRRCCFHSPGDHRAPDTVANKTGTKRGSLFHFVRVSPNDRLVRVQYLDRWQCHMAKLDRSAYPCRAIPFLKLEERLVNSCLILPSRVLAKHLGGRR